MAGKLTKRAASATSDTRAVSGVRSLRRVRAGLLGSTALVAVSLAVSPVFAQTVANPIDGGTITRTGGSAPTVSDQSASGGGVQITNVSQATTTNVNGVSIENITGAPSLDALRIAGSTSGLNSTGVTLTGANLLTSSLNGGSALYVTTNANMGVGITSSGSVFQGSYGVNLQASNGYVDFNASGQSQSFYGIGTHVAGFNAVTSINGSIRLGASTFTGFDTGVNVSTPLGAFVEMTGGSINALLTGIRADATNGGNTIESQAAIVAPTGIHSTNTDGTTVTTCGAGTINSSAAGTGTGIIATSSGGTNAVNVNVGAAIGTTTAHGVGVLASTTGTSTGAINISTTANIIATGRAISATAGTFGNTGTITLGGNVTGATGVYTNVGDYTVNVAQGVTVHGNGAGSTNAGMYLVNGTTTLVNNGTISYAGTGPGAGAVHLSSNGLVTNTATGLITGDSGVWLQNSATVANAGMITGTGQVTGGAGVYGLSGANVTNTGTITGYDGVYTGGNPTTHANTGGTITGIAHGYNVTGGRFTLTNTGVINTVGGTGGAGLSGVRLNTSLTQINTITNSGAITGGGDATHGYGVEVEDGLLTLTNQSGGVISGGIGGILLSNDDLSTINLNAGSTVTGQIVSRNTGDRTINVAGTITGDYVGTAGTGGTIFGLTAGGAIQGASFGNATTTFNWTGGTIAGAVTTTNGGYQNLNVNLGAGGTGTIGGISRFFLNANSGTVTLVGSNATALKLAGGNIILDTDLAVGATTSFQNATGSTLTVNSGRTLSSGAATVNFSVAGTVNNAGTISGGQANGISNTFYFYGVSNQASGSVINNSGTIAVGEYNLVAAIQNSSNLQVNNTGLIRAGSVASALATDGIRSYGGVLTVANSAAGSSIITGHEAGILTTGGTLSLTNAGYVVGGVNAINVAGAATITNTGNIGAGQVTNAGVFTANGTGSAILFGNGGALTNSGNVSGPNGAIAAAGTGATSITNNATGRIVSAGDAYAISTSGATTITNAGVIGTGTVTSGGVYTPGGSYTAIHTLAAGVIRNSGVIEGESGGILAATSLDLRNTGVITARGAGNGVSMDAAFVTGTATILNSGSMTSAIYSAVVAQGANSVVTNAAAGSLMGGTHALFGEAIQFGATNATFINYGAATSAVGRGVLAGDGGITVNLHAGSTTGSIETGAGNDTLALYSGRGTAGAATIDAASGITLQNAGALAAATVGVVNLGGGTDTLQLRGSGDGTGANGVGGTLDLGGNPISTAEVLTKLDAGTWTLTGAAGVPGITINAGTGTPAGLLIFNGTGLTGTINVNGATVRANTTTAFGTGTLRMIDPTIEFAATGTYANDISLEVANGQQASDPTILRNISGGPVTLAGRIYETGGVGGANQYVTFDGAGTTILTNTGNVWGGVTAINSGATLQGATNTISGGSIANAGALVFSQTLDGTYAGVISGVGVVQIDSPTQSVTLSGANTFSGATAITAGTLIASGGAGIGDLSAVTIASGATLQLANSETIGSLAGAGTARILGNTLNLGGDNTSTTFSGSITDQTPVAYIGSWIVSDGANWSTNPPTYTGQEAAAFLFGGTAGNYRISTAGASTGTITDTAWYNRYGGNPNYVEAANNYRVDTGGAGYNAQQDTSAYVQDHTGDVRTNYAFNGGLSLGGGLTKTGTGTLTLSGTNIYTGLTSITGGVLEVQNGSAISDVGIVNVLNSGAFTVTDSETIGSLTGSGATTIAGGQTLTLAAGSGAYTGAVTGGDLSLASGSWTFGGQRSGGDATGINLTGPSAVLTIAGTGSVTGVQYGVFAGAGGSIINQSGGLISGTTLAGVYATGATTLSNAGTITSSGVGGVDAVTIVGQGTITNTGVITSAANGGSGIAVTGAGSTITNSGLITGSNSVAYGFGVQNAAASGLVTITNQSGGVIGGGMGSILLNGAGNTNINLQAGSTANGQILSYANGTHNVSVAGTLNGAYVATTGSGADNLTLAVTGSMASASLGGGIDSFTYQGGAFTGLIDAGAGTDSFTSNLSGGVASVNLSNLANFETFGHQSGALTLTGTSGFSGGASVTGGSLIVNGTLQSTASVSNGASLRGGGSITGAVSVANGGVLANAQGSTLTMGSLSLLSGSTINATFSGAGGPALFAVTGNLTLDGTVNVASTGAYGFGVYGLMNYGGVLTDNGLVIGTTPGSAQRLSVQTSVAGQVNIVHAPTDLLFWDGGNAGQHDNGAVNGGTGVWTASGSEWTDANGMFNGTMEPQPGFAIFQGAGGTVTVDDVNGAVGVTGMQFAANGYRIEGDSITLANPGTTVRVGDGTAPSAAWTAVVASELTGAGGLVKTDLGTLILTGDNSYTGGTTVNAGVLQIGDGGATGAFTGAAVLGNGAALNFNRSDNSVFNNAVSGTGSVGVTGVVTLTGAITATNGVNITAGSTVTLSDISLLNGAAVLAGQNATVNVASGGAVRSQTGTGVFFNAGAGTLANAGAIFAGGNAVFSNGDLNLTNAASGAIDGLFVVGALGNLTLTNAGTINASVANFNNSGIYAGGTGAIANTGAITSGTNAIYIQGVGSVSNAGLIQGGGAASTIRLFGANSTVVNLAGGQIDTTGMGVGVYLDGAGATVTNAGSIRGANSINLVTGGTVINSGVLTGTAASGVFGNAMTLANNVGGAITGATNGVRFGSGAGALINAGSITGALNGVSAAAGLTLTSTGAITGATNAVESLGLFNDSLTFASGSTTTGQVLTNGGDDLVSLAGSLDGALFAGEGSDTVILFDSGSFSSVLDGGDGVDVFVLDGTGTGTASMVNVLNFESRVKQGSGAFTLTGADVSSADWTINAGTLRASGGASINDAVTVTVGANGVLGLVDSETIGALNGTGAVDLGGSYLTLGTGGTYAGVIGGTGGLILNSGLLTLSGANTWSGGTDIVGGALALGASDVLSDQTYVRVASGAVFDLGVFSDTIAQINLSGELTGAGTLSANSYILDGAAVNANLGAGSLFNVGGTSVLNGTSGAANVVVQGGTLVLGASDRLADTATVSVAAGSTLNMDVFNDTVRLAMLNGTLAGTGTLTAAEYDLNGATINANLGQGNLFNVGGTSVLNGTSGATNVAVQGGTLRLGASERLADTAVLSIASGATFDVNGNQERIGALFGTGALTVGAGNLTFGGPESAFGGVISGTGSITHTGGLFTLLGAQTISSIRNTGGELRLLGSTTGGVALSGGSLTGAGTINGLVNITNGATLSPGLVGQNNSIGGFTLGSLTMNGGRLAIDVLGTSGNNLVDQLLVRGNANLTGGILAPTFVGPITDFNFSTRYVFLSANSLTGTFANGSDFTADTSKAGLFWRVRYDLSPNSAVLELRQLTTFDPGASGSGNQSAVAEALNGGQLQASDDFGAVLAVIAGLNPGQQRAAFDSLSGEAIADTTTSLQTLNDGFLTTLREAGSDDQAAGGGALNFSRQLSFAGGRDNRASMLADVLNAYDPSASVGGASAGWFSAYASDARLNGKNGTASLDSRASGFAGGYGAKVGPILIGGAAGVAKLEGEVDRRQSTFDADVTQGALYVRFDDGQWAADVTASAYRGDMDTLRAITIGNFGGLASGRTDFEGRSVSASLARRFQVTPTATVAIGAQATASRVNVDAFTEQGAGVVSLAVGEQERSWQTGQISVRGTQAFKLNGQNFSVYAGTGVMGTGGDRSGYADMRFTGAPTSFGAFTVEGVETPRMAGVADFGIQTKAGEGVTISTGYRGVFSERLHDNQIGVRVRMSW